MGFLLGLASNVVANIVFWVSLGTVFWVVSTVVVRRFSSFFGLGRVRCVTVYLSNLWTPEVSRSGRTDGYTICLHELQAAQSVDKLFGSAPLRLPDLVRGLVDALWLHHRVQCAIAVSPLKAEDADLDRNLIVVGNSARNSVRAHYLRARLPTAILTGEEPPPGYTLTPDNLRCITILRGGGKGEVSLADANLAIVERCRDPDRGTTLFFCLGERAEGSWAATEYLVRNWKRLASEFKDGDFLLCLGFPKTERHLDVYREPLRLSLGSG